MGDTEGHSADDPLAEALAAFDDLLADGREGPPRGDRERQIEKGQASHCRAQSKDQVDGDLTGRRARSLGSPDPYAWSGRSGRATEKGLSSWDSRRLAQELVKFSLEIGRHPIHELPPFMPRSIPPKSPGAAIYHKVLGFSY